MTTTTRSENQRSRPINEVFEEFREVFDPEYSDSLSIRAYSDLDEDRDEYRRSRERNSDRNEPERRERRSNEQDENMPSWARSLIQDQQKALADLRSEIRSLKRKRDDKENDEFEWKKKGNKRQYEFNKSVEEQLDSIATANTLLEARTYAEKGLSILSERQKLIKIADKHGWDTVNNYVSDPLAKDEADDKKLRKAVKEAEKSREKTKREKEAKSRRSARSRLFTSNQSPFSSNRLGPLPSETSSRVVLPNDGKKYSQPRCFKCSKIGHMARDCLADVNSKS